MPDQDKADLNSAPKRHFMREKIRKPPLTRGQMAKRIIALLFVAMIFGVAAGVSFALARPLAERYLVSEPSEESVPITIPKDEPESAEPETEPETFPATEETETTEPIEDILQNALEGYQYSMADLTTIHNNLRVVVQKVEKGIVEVHSVRREVDWFDNPVENTGVYSGIILSITPSEVLIMTPVKAVENADSIKVTFGIHGDVDGSIKQIDHILGMAIVSVDNTHLEDGVLQDIAEVELGNSYSSRQGDIVIAVGGPAGLVHSTSYGEISYILKSYPRIDGISRVFYADIRSNTDIGTFLLNTEGQMIGWVTNLYQDEIDTQLPLAVGVSEYKGILERLSNGKSAPYFGIKAQEISKEMIETGVPAGVYVSMVITDSPAYNGGIQNGDIVTRIGETGIFSVKDVQSSVEGLEEGREVIVVVQRNGVEEYKELEFQVTIGAR